MHTTDPPVTTAGAWHFALPMTAAHYIPPGQPVRDRDGVLLADGPCGYPARLGDDDPSVLIERCPLCVRWVAGWCLMCGGGGRLQHMRSLPGGGWLRSESVCQPCSGTGRHREVVA